MSFREVDIKSLKLNPFVMLDDEWGLLTAGNEETYNTMTIAWGSMGIMWRKPTFTVVVRPQRYTYEFIEKYNTFTVSFYPESCRSALNLLGKKSGRDGDKIAESGLTPFFTDDTVAFEEAHTIFICRKLYGGHQYESAKFVDKELDREIYPTKDHHYVYTGEIEKVLQK